MVSLSFPYDFQGDRVTLVTVLVNYTRISWHMCTKEQNVIASLL
jgi:hypothetical protein